MENAVHVLKRDTELKALAREQLSGIWGKSALLTLMYFVIGILPGQLLLYIFKASSSTISFVDIILTAPVTIGMAMCYLNLVRGKNFNVLDILNGFKYFITVVVVYGIVDSMNIISLILTDIITMNKGISVFISILFGILSIFLFLMYSMVYYIILDDPRIGIKGALTSSRKLLHGQIWRLFCLQLSFIGWILLGVLSAGIGTLWVFPYIQVTMANLYLDLKKRETNNRLEIKGL